MNDRRSTATGSARLFLALWPDVAVRERLALERDRWRWTQRARPVAAERLHVTLHFIGPVERVQLPDLVASLDFPMAPFALRFGCHALWRNGIAAYEPIESPALHALQRSVGELLTGLGLPVEARSYRPHVTMARDATGSTVPPVVDPRGPAGTWAWPISEYTLVESRPGGRYEVVAVYR